MQHCKEGFIRTWVASVLIAAAMVGCGGSDGHDQPRTTGSDDVVDGGGEIVDGGEIVGGGEVITPAPQQISLSGRLVAPDGTTPMVNATIYLPESAVVRAAGVKAVGIDCETPPVAYQVATCTNGDGSFTLIVPEGLLSELVAVKGAFSANIAFDSREASSDVPMDIGVVEVETDTESENATRMAVVTGSYDSIQNVLAKTGFGEIDELGHLVPGTEKFDLYDGGGYVGETKPGFSQLFTDRGDGLPRLHDYDIVFINCGVNEYETDNGADPVSSAVTTALRAYVEAGGRLYMTDLAYDYLEQTFPAYIDFDGSDETAAATAENPNDAETGTGGITVPNASVLDSSLLAFLGNVTCENNAACLNADNSLLIEGLLSSWAVMDAAHDTTTAPVNFYVSGAVSTSNEAESVKPLTASFRLGDGKVFYSSYHTEDRDSIYFLPQERVLQFLVFE